jgi:PBP1b-binding outer membrane lipoprotein LpoB
MNQRLFLFLVFIFFLACNNPVATESVATATGGKDTAAPKSFLPVTDFIAGEIRMIDSLQLPATKTITINKKDNLYPLTTAELRLLANEFLQPDINDPAIKQFYKETSVADQSSGAINFVYSTTNTSLEIQRLDVNLKGDPVLNDKVNSIYIEKITKSGDSVINKKLFWKFGKNFQVTTEKRLDKQVFPRQTLKVVWDPTE